jgi:diguanylate cyclase (GGDEF)-like protein
MDKKLTIIFCNSYQKEAEEIFRRHRWKNINAVFFPEVCRYPHLRQGIEEQLETLRKNPESEVQMIGCYTNCIDSQERPHDSSRKCLQQCLHMLVPPSIATFYFDQGIHLFPSGWLLHWREHLTQWGLDQQTAREMYHESAKELVLVDTLLAPDSEQSLRLFGEYLDLPTNRLPIGLDYMTMHLVNIVLDWQHKQDIDRIQSMMRESNQTLADYAMAIDLLMNLTQIHNETEAITEIVDLYTMLFSAERVIYLPAHQGTIIKRGDHSLSNEEYQTILNWSLDHESNFLEVSTGFYLKIEHEHELIGILIIDDLSLPAYKQRYKNIALSIIQVCGLAIANTRMFQKIISAEEKANYEREISETFRNLLNNLVTQQTFDDVLEQTLIALNKLVPIQRAVIYLLKDQHYQYQGGLQLDQNNELSTYIPPENLSDIPIDLLSFQDGLFEQHINQDDLHTTRQEDNPQRCKPFPLIIRGEVKGFLGLKSVDASAVDHQEEIIQMFVNEVAIAIENARLFKEINDIANKDGLTDIYNRRYFYHLAKTEFARANRYQKPLTILMLDIDHFKLVNDRYGHLCGDEILKQVTQLCLKSIREIDILGRYGGEEFVFALPETSLEAAGIMAERIRNTIANTEFQYKEAVLKITVSIGLAGLNSSVSKFEELLEFSDAALYMAKEKGRNRVESYSHHP